MREVDLSGDDLLTRHTEVFTLLRQLGNAVDTDHWCLIGGLLVYVVSHEHHAKPNRSAQTKDADVVINVLARSVSDITDVLMNTLLMKPMEPFMGQDKAPCTFFSGASTRIDVLAPDTATEEQLLDGDRETVAAPGGQRALEAATLATIYYSDDEFVDVRVPELFDAIVVKLHAAADENVAHERHDADVVELLAILPSRPEVVSDDDMALLANHGRALIDRPVGACLPMSLMKPKLDWTYCSGTRAPEPRPKTG